MQPALALTSVDGIPPDWALAKCTSTNSVDPTEHRPDGFFPERGTAQVTARDAKKVCNGEDGRPVCPVRETCLEYALETKERFGIWGGKSERERAKITRDRKNRRNDDAQEPELQIDVKRRERKIKPRAQKRQTRQVQHSEQLTTRTVVAIGSGRGNSGTWTISATGGRRSA